MGDEPPTAELLDVLADERCRDIVAALTRTSEGLSAGALAERLDIPQSTMYRKLDRLAATPLVGQHATVADGQHMTVYRVAVDDLVVELADGFAVSVNRTEGREPDPPRA